MHERHEKSYNQYDFRCTFKNNMLDSIGLDYSSKTDKIDNNSTDIFSEVSTMIYFGKKPQIGTLSL